MNTVMSVVLALALTLSAMPAIAGDTFQAFSTLPATEQATLTPLPDDQLAAIKGAEGLLVQINPLLSNFLEAVYLSLLANLPEQATAAPSHITGSTTQVYSHQMQEGLGEAVQTTVMKMSQY